MPQCLYCLFIRISAGAGVGHDSCFRTGCLFCLFRRKTMLMAAARCRNLFCIGILAAFTGKGSDSRLRCSRLLGDFADIFMSQCCFLKGLFIPTDRTASGQRTIMGTVCFCSRPVTEFMCRTNDRYVYADSRSLFIVCNIITIGSLIGIGSCLLR